MDQENQPLFGLSIDGQAASTISSSVQWARILAICGIVFGGVFVLLGIFFKTFMSKTMSMGGGLESDTVDKNAALGAGIGMVIYILMGALAILGNTFLLNYANKTSRALKTNDSAMLNSGFAGLRNYCAFWAVIMILCLLLFLLSIVTMGLM
jgi:hypothetical protein